MRNLKKVLSLVLCMAMMLSVMVVGAGAAFKDQNKIVNTEAVDMCSALNIINGYTDGSFKPEGTITRAEACKMICVALNGGKEPVLGTSATASFTDTKGHWAEGYIESCVAQGVVAGVGGGKFDPNGTVTGSQFAKMLLIALGYNAQHAQFLGNAWEVNVNVVATQKDLYEDLETMDVSAALTRDNAAQMVWNALQAVIVEYDYTLVSTNGSLSSQVVVKDDEKGTTLLKDKYNASMTNDIYDTVTMTKYEWNDDNDEFDYTLTTDAKDKNNDVIVLTFSSTTDYTDLFAMQVNVVYKNNKDQDVYGIYAEDSVILYEGVVADIEAYDDDYVKVDGTKYKVDNASITKNSLAGIEAYAENVYTAGGIASVEKSNTMKVIDLDGNGKIDCIVYLPFETAKVTYVGTKNISVNGASITSATFEDDYIYDGIAKDDYVAVVAAVNTAYDGDVITKLDSVAGTVDATRDNGKEVKVDGTWYTLALNSQSTVKSLKVNNDYTLYQVAGYVYFAEDGDNNQTLDDLVFVKTIANVNAIDGYKAKVVFADGTETTVSLTDSYFDYAQIADDNEDGEVDYTAQNISALGGKFFTFEKDGEDYELTVVEDVDNDLGYDKVTDAGAYGITAKDDSKAGKIGLTSNKIVAGTYAIADDAVIFVIASDGDVDVVAGTAAKAYKDAVIGKNGGVVMYDEVNGVNTVKVAAIFNTAKDLPNASGTSDNYGYVVSAVSSIKVDGDKYYQFDMWNGSDVVTVITDDSAAKNLAKRAIITYTDLGNNEIDDVATVNGAYQAVKGTSGNELYLTRAALDLTTAWATPSVAISGDYGTYTSTAYITDDTVILYVDSEALTGNKDGSIVNAQEKFVDGTSAKSYYMLTNVFTYDEPTADGELELVVVEVNNEWTF